MQTSSNTINILTNKGVRTEDGKEYDADAVIFATGFDLEVGLMMIRGIIKYRISRIQHCGWWCDSDVLQLQSLILKKEKMMIIITIIIRIHLIILIITRLVQSLTLKKD